ncbi:hypothetical protein B0H14DRAFT_3504468 [Mycena olivaceomarginata]|nr:hypothetical protein B0H14DRAFT_3504468 [Mycena olivaceomarginata]
MLTHSPTPLDSVPRPRTTRHQHYQEKIVRPRITLSIPGARTSLHQHACKHTLPSISTASGGSFNDSPPMSPSDLYTQRLTLLYPWQGPARDTALIVFPPDAVTLRDPDILEHSFWFSPAECKICPKPHFTHEAIPAASFTIILSCPHHPQR